MNIEQLIVLFKQKNLNAFQKMYEMYFDNVFGAIYLIVRNSELAEELANDVFVNVWNHSDSYDASKGRFFTWILKIARNKAIDELRSKSFKKDQITHSLNFLMFTIQSQKDIDFNTDNREMDFILKHVQSKHLKIIDLIYFRGYTQREVAEELKIPLGTVKSRNRNCIAHLRAIKEISSWIY